MSLGNTDQTTFLTVRKGKLCLTVPEGTPKALTREKEDGSLAYELRYEWINGHIIDVAKKETNWQKPSGETQLIRSWVITIIDESWKEYKIEMQYSSSYSKSFFNRLPRLDFRHQVRILVGESEHEADKTKMRPWLSTSQNKVKTIPMWTRENPGKLPQLEISEDANGKKTYDDSKQMAFYEEMLETIKYGFQHPDGTFTYTKEEPNTATATTSTNPEGGADLVKQETDDLPF